MLCRRSRRRDVWTAVVARLSRTCLWLLFGLLLAVGLWYRDLGAMASQVLADTQRVSQILLRGPLDLLAQQPWQHTAAMAALALGLLGASINLLAIVLFMVGRTTAPLWRALAVGRQRLRYGWQRSLARTVLIEQWTRLFSRVGLDGMTPRMSLRPTVPPSAVGGRRQLDNALAALRALADEQLRRIRFLQTHTAGWSGKLSTTKGAILGWERSIQRAEQPLTHPEVVEQFRDFLERAAKVLRDSGEISGMTIAIDELDKIDKPEQAHEFINEIKGVFGVEHCLFVVSVSQDALTSFERRGIPVRDALDSAFVSMVAVDPFSLEESRHWLSRRVIGLPQPFICLCHCLSGGMPRELTRTATAVHDLLRDHGRISIEKAARMLVADDLARKVRAFSYATQQLSPAEDVGEFVVRLNTEHDLGDSDALTALATDLVIPTATATPGLAALRSEAASYLYFCATLRDSDLRK